MLSFDTLGGVHHQDYIIINQDLGVLVFTQNPSDSTICILNFQTGEKVKHPNDHTALCCAKLFGKFSESLKRL